MVRRCVVRFLCFFTLLALVACGTDSQSGASETGVKAGPGGVGATLRAEGEE